MRESGSLQTEIQEGENEVVEHANGGSWTGYLWTLASWRPIEDKSKKRRAQRERQGPGMLALEEEEKEEEEYQNWDDVREYGGAPAWHMGSVIPFRNR